MSLVHHTVNQNATPFGDFTKWLRAVENVLMDIAAVRRSNLQRFVDTRLRGVKAEVTKALRIESKSYVSELLNPKKKKKAFGEKAARKIEAALGLEMGQLDIPDSPLKMVQPPPATELKPETDAEKRAVAKLLREMRHKHAS